MSVLNYIFQYFINFWQVFSAMAPWLLFGYFLAGCIAFILTPEQIKKHLRDGGFKSVLKAVLFGVPMPICSCGVIPVAAVLREEGAGKGPVSAFFVSTPQTGIDNFILTWSMLGWPLALVRLLTAYITGIISGALVNTSDKENAPAPGKEEKKCCCCCHQDKHKTPKKDWKNAPKFIFHYGFVKMFKSMSPSLMLGMFIAAFIQMILPENFGADVIGDKVWLQFIIVIALALPLYVCSNASVPIAVALVLKGFSPGAALVFLIAGPGISSVSITSMKAMLGSKATFISVASIGLIAIASGIIVNLFNIPFNTPDIYGAAQKHMFYIRNICGVLLALPIVYALYSKYIKR